MFFCFVLIFFLLFLMTAPVPRHHAEHQSQRQAWVCQSSDGRAYGHVEPDPGPLGLHSAEESCPEEDLYVAKQLLGSKIPSSLPQAAKFSQQHSGKNQQLDGRPGRCTSAKHWDQVYQLNLCVPIIP